jgi:DNA mismatch repair protein MutS
MRLTRETLAGCPDIERALCRIKFNKFSPRDFGDIRESLRIIASLKDVFLDVEAPSEGEYFFEKLKNFSELYKMLKSALAERLSVTHNISGVIADGYSQQLDKLRYLKNHSEELIADLQQKYVADTGINTLKIKNNAILGWYIEVSLLQKSKIPNYFIHRQTLVNGVRYTTEDLISLQADLENVLEEQSLEEERLYREITEEVLKFGEDISYAVKTLSLLDIYANLACVALERNYVRPEISSDPILEIEDGRHPVLDLHVKEFAANNCDLTAESKICLLTGPNMAGKSTYLRQNALIVILAQIGSYVPAAKASVGIVDRLFSRIGASDDIARGRSTFMVEMIETAAILNQATEKSFVILDEVGRGTSTYDGLSIAWAVIENLYKVNKCRVLFATHYRELTALQKSLKNIRCKTLKVREWKGEVVFYHKITDGIADKSYGIHVAEVAGVPKPVLRRATELLKNFEKTGNKTFSNIIDLSEQAELDYPEDDAVSAVKQKLQSLNIDEISPNHALEILQDLKNTVY